MSQIITNRPSLEIPQHPVLDLSIPSLEAAVGSPWQHWSHQCHAVSLKLVRSGFFSERAIGARVARGTHPGVGGQHSWVVLDEGFATPEEVDVYEPSGTALVLDLTLWSYDHDEAVVTLAEASDRRWLPAGYGSIWSYGQPQRGGGEVIDLTPEAPLSDDATEFLAMLGPLDRQGWMQLAHAPVLGWPSQEILAAMDATKAITALLPIDLVGNRTAVNPSRMYW